MKKIIGLGNALVDVLAQIENETLLEELNLPKGSMQLIDAGRYASVSRRLAEMPTQCATGGSAANTMLALAQLGATPGFIGKIGNDAFGRIFAENCRTCGIRPFLAEGETPTGVASTFITPDGQRTFATFLGAAAEVTASDLDAHIFAGYGFLYIEGYLVQNHLLIETAVDLARQAGLRVCIDLASYNIVEADRDFFAQLLRKTDIVFANEEEAHAFTGKAPAEALEELAGLCEIAVVKVGKEGAMAACGAQRALAPAMADIVVRDTTAAGDFFAAGFLYALTRGATPEVCLRCGALLAGNVIQVIGTKLPEKVWEQIRQRVAALLAGTTTEV